MDDEPFLIDLSAPAIPGYGQSPGDDPRIKRRRYLWAAGLVALAAFAAVWIPLHENPPTAVSIGFPPTIEGIPLSSGGPVEISGNATTRQAWYRFPLTNAGDSPIQVERIYAPVPGLVLLHSDPAHASIAARQSQTVTLTFAVSDCPDVLMQEDQRTLRVVVATDLGPVEWQVSLAALLPDRQWQVDIASAACSG
ncbi:hypothetical protein [Rugosimonospora africana]|uniref:Uncharacterized protein n=1 Tax=Rugosimonospora africana TaxID=556532 RepID=A0A8J3QXD1_9ACTN|nr:hypothetical protein [Rugosimonospora africana]GIH17558.1 hypothetical protein Raf01_57300 [Rugosimonospora africana]